jgi:hypothetical protein
VTEVHPALSRSLKATNPVFLEEEDTDDELDGSLAGGKEKVVITPEFVLKNKKAFMSKLEKMNREEVMKEVASKLTFGDATPGNATIVNSATPSNTAVTGATTQTNSAVIGATRPVVPVRIDQPGQEGNVLQYCHLCLQQ